MAKKKEFAVFKLGDDGSIGHGSFVVQAASPRGAFRIVRNNYAHMITDHMSRERWVLFCNNVTSDCRGILRINH